MNGVSKVLALLLALVTALGLAACGGPSDVEQQAKVPGTNTIQTDTGPSTMRGYHTDSVHTTDGKTVLCLRYYDGGSSSSVISCDWEHAK